ncbi:hypothetical protein [Anabaena sp. CCY 9402-a]|uniref:hypothetical protein n=1 Tax=Anabaena sp. CCY 9402-a TaxID=3103867 RepID=UPI0039C732B6
MQSQRMWLLISAELKVLSYEYYIGLTHNSARTKRAATANSTPHSSLSTPHSALSTQHSALLTPHSALSTQHSALID